MEGPGKTRIDLVLANEIARRIVENLEYLFEEAQGFDHLPIKLTLGVEAMKQSINVMLKPQPINTQSYDAKMHTPEVRSTIWQATWEKYKDDFDNAIEVRCINTAHKVWCHAMEDFLHTLLYFEHSKYSIKKFTRGQLQPIKNMRAGQAYRP